ncbi:MAG: zinc ribbon domain-containing protein [Chloroflexi bacterium]|nr:zinc ribbon domain-containing protein [Chloroflexota bacterium]
MSAELAAVAGVLLAVVAVLWVIMPLRKTSMMAAAQEAPLANLMALRETAYQVLRDLDSDYQSGKIAEDDYRPSRVQALAHAAEIVAQLDAYQATPGQPSQPPRAACPRCGTAHQPEDAFCRKCGQSLIRARAVP